jgi:hypothetical protein
MVINKNSVSSHLRDKKSILYNYLVADNISRTLLSEYRDILHVNLYLDLSMSELSRNQFNSYFSNKMSWLSSIANDNQHNITNEVFHVCSHNEPCIQLADYLSGTLYRSYEYNEPQYYEMIMNKIKYNVEWS